MAERIGVVVLEGHKFHPSNSSLLGPVAGWQMLKMKTVTVRHPKSSRMHDLSS
jgi:hypothetical protein